MKMLHIGRRAPKGWREVPDVHAIHLGCGVWAMWVEPVPAEPVPAERHEAGPDGGRGGEGEGM
jgi:hypothetical protein